jgi:hypothetical protein
MSRVSEIEQQFLVQVARFQFVAQLLQRRLDRRAFQLEQIDDLPNAKNTHKKPAAVGSKAKENKGEKRKKGGQSEQCTREMRTSDLHEHECIVEGQLSQ